MPAVHALATPRAVVAGMTAQFPKVRIRLEPLHSFPTPPRRHKLKKLGNVTLGDRLGSLEPLASTKHSRSAPLLDFDSLQSSQEREERAALKAAQLRVEALRTSLDRAHRETLKRHKQLDALDGRLSEAVEAAADSSATAEQLTFRDSLEQQIAAAEAGYGEALHDRRTIRFMSERLIDQLSRQAPRLAALGDDLTGLASDVSAVEDVPRQISAEWHAELQRMDATRRTLSTTVRRRERAVALRSKADAKEEKDLAFLAATQATSQQRARQAVARRDDAKAKAAQAAARAAAATAEGRSVTAADDAHRWLSAAEGGAVLLHQARIAKEARLDELKAELGAAASELELTRYGLGRGPAGDHGPAHEADELADVQGARARADASKRKLARVERRGGAVGDLLSQARLSIAALKAATDAAIEGGTGWAAASGRHSGGGVDDDDDVFELLVREARELRRGSSTSSDAPSSPSLRRSAARSAQLLEHLVNVTSNLHRLNAFWGTDVRQLYELHRVEEEYAKLALPPLPPDGAVGASGAAEGDDSCSESDGSDDDDDEVAGGEAPLAYATVKLCAEAPRSRSPPLAARVVLAEPRVPPPAIVEVSFR